MNKIKLGKTELEVSEICLGADYFGSKHDLDAAFAMLDCFREGGGNFVDTANIYARDWDGGFSRSECILGEYLKSRGKSSLVIATKGAHPNPATMHTPRINRTDIEHDVDESLKSLGLDCIDFYYLHRDDPSMPIGEILELLEGFVRAGKIRYYGGSNYALSRVVEADKYAREHGITGFSGISNMWCPAHQNDGSPLSKDDTLVPNTDADLDVMHELGVAIIPYHSTAKGWFAKHAAGIANERLDPVFVSDYNLALLGKLKGAAEVNSTSVQTELLRYIRSLDTNIIPITSVSSMAQLEDVLAV
ncbi:MAG: aldo/keto reductase [Clostridiales bacterium]|nr:aldo/keto reductase [Clostridiales bacterium]